MLTRESRPIEKIKGQEAVGGAINGEDAIILEVPKTGEVYLPIGGQFWTPIPRLEGHYCNRNTSRTTTSKKLEQSKSIHLRMKLLGLRAGVATHLQI